MNKISVFIRTAVCVLLTISTAFGGFLAPFAVRAERQNTTSNLTTIQNTSNNPQPDKTSRKLALLVGIDGYYKNSKIEDHDWWNLHTTGDVEIIASALVSKFGFKPEDIKVLSDKPVKIGDKTINPTDSTKPTRDNIVNAFRSHLTKQASDGDIVYFHFSGHGQQVPDDDKNGPNPMVGDELDGMDESIIPIDYVSQTDPSKNIRDDEIGTLLDELSAKKPANVTITLDSCFSGTATRGKIARGADWKGKPVDRKMIKGSDESAADFVTRGGRSRGGNGEQNYVFLSAASQYQTAKEKTENQIEYGAFSYALAKAMEKADDKTTYRDLFQTLNDQITQERRDQNPQIEGSQLDKIVMKDGALPPQKFVNVKFSEKGIPFLAAGKLQGMTSGSKFNLCVQTAKDCKDGTQIVSAEIVRVNPTTSTIKLTGTPAPDKLKTANRAFETLHSYEGVLKVAVRESKTQKTRGTVVSKEVFDNLGIAEKVSEADKTWNVLIRPSDDLDVKENKIASNFRGLVLQRTDNSIIATVADDADSNNNVQEALKAEANWLTIKSLDDNVDAELAGKIKLEIIPVGFAKDEITGESLGLKDKPKESLTSRGGKTELKVGDFIRLEVTNTSDRPLYVTILDLRPDGKIGPAFPLTANTENQIPAGKTVKIPNAFEVKEPLGQESYRVIVTATQTDFTPLIDPSLIRRTQGGDFDNERGRNAANSPLGKILKGLPTGKRGDPVAPPASWATTEITFFVVKPEESTTNKPR